MNVAHIFSKVLLSIDLSSEVFWLQPPLINDGFFSVMLISVPQNARALQTTDGIPKKQMVSFLNVVLSWDLGLTQPWEENKGG